VGTSGMVTEDTETFGSVFRAVIFNTVKQYSSNESVWGPYVITSYT
jgi:hypothetical protein